jgi:hypothetical protein
LCGSTFFNASDDARAAIMSRLQEFNTVLSTECATYANCRYDGGALFAHQWTRAEVSTVDNLHPSVAGENMIATTLWNAGFWPDSAVSTSTTTSTSSTTTTSPASPCTGGAAATKPKLIASKVLPPAGDDKLTISGEAVVPTTPPLDLAGRGVRLVLTGATAASLLDVTLEPGAYDASVKTGWKVNRAQTAWTYKGPGTGTAGIQTVSVKLSKTIPGGIKFKAKGKNGTYPVAISDVPLRATLVLDVPAAASGQCVEVSFPAAPPERPSCLVAIGGNTVKCK